jgi:hypothetical protein
VRNVLAFLFFTAALAVSVNASGQTNAWRMCDGCTLSQMAQCAIQTTGVHNLKTGDYVWTFDFQNETSVKFYMQVSPPGTIIQGESDHLSGDQTQGGQILPIQTSLTPTEAQTVGVLMFFVNDVWRPQGAGYAYPSCTNTQMAEHIELSDYHSNQESEIRSEGVIVLPIEIPPGPDQNRAYDVFGYLALANQLAAAHAGMAGLLGEIQSVLYSFVPISPVNTNTQLKLVFDDGSYGIWKFNFQSDQWEPDWSTFRDSEDNPIPMTPADMVGRVYGFSDTPEGQNSLTDFLQRARMFGIPITGPGGGGPLPTRCRMESDGLRCWPASSF